MHLFTDASERLATAPFLAVVGFPAPGSLTSRHAVSPAKNSTRSHWRAQHGVTSGPLSGVEFHSDNQAVVSSLRKGSCRCSNVMSLLRRLLLVCALQNFSVSASYVEGVANGIADSLSGQDFSRFRTLAPQAAAIPDTTRPLPSIPGSPHWCRALLRAATASPNDTLALRRWSVPPPHVLQHASTSTFSSNRDLSTSQRTNHGRHQPPLLRVQERRSPVTSTSNVGGTAVAGKRPSRRVP